MLKRKKPRQNSTNTSPSSSPPHQGIVGIISTNELNQKLLQHKNNSNGDQIITSNGNGSHHNHHNHSNNHSPTKGHDNSRSKNKKKKNKHKKSPTSTTATTNSNNNSNGTSTTTPSSPSTLTINTKPLDDPIITTTTTESNNSNSTTTTTVNTTMNGNKVFSKKYQKSTTESNNNNGSSPNGIHEEPKIHTLDPSNTQDFIPLFSKKDNNSININSITITSPIQKSPPSPSQNGNHNNNNNNNHHHHQFYNNPVFNHNRKNKDKLQFKEKISHVPIWLEGVYTIKDLQDVTLEREIDLFCKWLEPNQFETRLRLKIIKEIESIVLSNWPKADVVVFGSFSSNLCIPSSDIDIQISNINENSGGGTGNNVNSNKQQQYFYNSNPIRDLYNILIKNYQNSFTNCRLISGAKVPIIKMTAQHSYYNIDICFDTPNGIENTKVVKGLLRKYKSMKTLLMVLKYFLYQNNLNETYSGGIGSYALALMVVSFIQLRYVPHSLRTHQSNSKQRDGIKDASDDTDYGAMLVEFLELYGRSFNYSQYGISLENGGFYYVKDEQWGTSLTLIDPHDRENDVGKNSFNIPFIRGVFTNCLLKIVSNEAVKDYYSKFTFPTLLTRIIEERSVEQIARERSNITKFGVSLEEKGQLTPLIDIDEMLPVKIDNLPVKPSFVIGRKTPSKDIVINVDNSNSNDRSKSPHPHQQSEPQYIDVSSNSSSSGSSSSSGGSEEFSDESNSQHDDSDVHSSYSNSLCDFSDSEEESKSSVAAAITTSAKESNRLIIEPKKQETPFDW